MSVFILNHIRRLEPKTPMRVRSQFNERLLDLFIEKFALDPTWVKNHACYDELRTYGAIAA